MNLKFWGGGRREEWGRGPTLFAYSCGVSAPLPALAVCQKLVEIESQSEQTQTLVVGVIGLVLAVAGFVAGTALDPMQTTDKGGSFF